MTKIKNKSKFTLIELVLATAIFAVLMFTTGMGLMSVQQSWRRIHYHSEKLKNLMAIDRLVELSFRNIIPFTWPDEDTEKEKQIFTGDKNTVLFATIHRINEGDPNALRFIKLYLENGCLIAEYRNTPILNKSKNQSPEGIRKEILATGIAQLSFLYLKNNESDEVEWVDDWQEDDPNDEVTIPLAIQMTVEWQNGDRYSWLRRTAGSGKNESLGIRKKGGGFGGTTFSPPKLGEDRGKPNEDASPTK